MDQNDVVTTCVKTIVGTLIYTTKSGGVFTTRAKENENAAEALRNFSDKEFEDRGSWSRYSG